MQFIPIKTRRLNPPQDDLLSVLDESCTDVREGDIILVTSKVVGIHQGRCVLKNEVEKNALVQQEADYVLPGGNALFPLTLKYQGFSVAGGVDSSNSGEYYSLLPTAPFEAAKKILEHIKDRHGVDKIAVIITDSCVKPMRVGVVGTAIGWWGMHPTDNHQGKLDLFGNPINFSATNIVDSLAAGSSAVCGEAGESTPVVIVRNVPNVIFTQNDTRQELLTDSKDDVYYPLLKAFYN